jgi:hypothetical protein
MNNLDKGTYLTPQTRPTVKLNASSAIQHTNINGGLVYTANKEIVPLSIDKRFSVIPLDTNLPIDDRSDDTFLFLGYYFRHYGHFILETLPMLSYCLDNEWSHINKMFLPYFLNGNNIVHNLHPNRHQDLFRMMNQFIKLIDIDPNKIKFHTNYSILKSNFIVPSKIVSGDRYQIDIVPYQKVITKIKQRFNNIEPNRKVLITRKPSTNRTTSEVTKLIIEFATKNNIETINMESLTIEDQIKLIHETKCLIGFSGSGMHNSMFLQPQSIAINICDIRDFMGPKCYIPNQQLCNRISGCQENFIHFKCQADMKKEYFKPPNDKLSLEQEIFAANNMIEKLQEIMP